MIGLVQERRAVWAASPIGEGRQVPDIVGLVEARWQKSCSSSPKMYLVIARREAGVNVDDQPDGATP